MNEQAVDLLAAMESDFEANSTKLKETEMYTSAIGALDQLRAQHRERARTLGLNPESDEFRLTFALAILMADEHVVTYAQLASNLTGLPMHVFFPEGMLTNGLWGVAR